MPDINTYALSIQLNFESNADVVLDDVSVRLDRINEQIQQIGNVYDTALGGAAAGVADATEQIATSMDEVSQSLNQSWPIMEDMEETIETGLDNLEEALDYHEQTEESLREQVETWENMLDPIGQARDGMRDVADGTGDISNNLDGTGRGARKLARGFFDIFLSIEAIKTAFAEFLELEEDFIYAHYRLYGAQEQIVGQVSAISDQYDLLRGTAHEAMKSLAISLRVPREELGKYVAQVSMFHRATGASIQQTSDWIRAMTLAGFTSGDTERSLGRMVLMMRQAGLTTAQINRFLSDQIDIASLLATSYDKEGVEAWNAGSAAMAAVTREVHGNAEAMMALQKNIVENIEVMGFLHQRSALTEADLIGLTKAERDFARAQSGTIELFRAIDAQTRGLDPGTAKIYFQTYGQMLKLSWQQTSDLNLAMRELRERFGDDWEAIAAHIEPMIDEFKAQNALMVEFGEAMNTVKARWEAALRPLFNAWINLMIALKPAMLFLIDAVGWLADVLGALIDVIAAIINPTAYFNRQLEDTAKAGKEAIGFFERLGSGIKNFAKALPGIIIGLTILIGLYYGLRLISELFINWVNRMRPANLLALAAAFWAMGASMLMMAAALAIVASLGWKAASALVILTAAMAGMVVTMRVLANVASSASIPLIKLAGIMLLFGVASLMMAASVMIVVEAMKSMVDMGDALIGALLSVAAIVAIIVGALVVLGYAALPVWPVILAIGAAFLMMGGAIWLAAKGFEIMIDSLARFGKSAMMVVLISGPLAVAVAIISVALLALAAVGLVAILPLLVLGAALTVLAAGAWLLAKAMDAAVVVIQDLVAIDTSAILRVGRDLMTFSMMLTAAAAMILLGSLWMIPAVFALRVAMLALATSLWFVPVDRLKAIAAAVNTFVEAMDALSSSLDQIESIAARGDSFGELATTISDALDEIEIQAMRADAIADSFVRMNEAIAGVFAGPPEPVYGEVAAALRDQMDAIEEQTARAEAIYAPVEGIAEQAEFAAALSGEPAPEGFAEPVVGGLAPEGGEDFMDTSNFMNLRKQTLLLEKIEAAMIPRAFSKAIKGFLGIPDRVGEAVKKALGKNGPEGNHKDGQAGEGGGEE